MSTEPNEATLKELEKVKEELKLEKIKNEELNKKLQKMTAANTNLQRVVEEEEDFIANKLTKKLDELQIEKKRLALQVEQEEEALTNNLQKKLDKLKKDKVELELQLEQEEEYIVNKLQKQLYDAMNEKDQLEEQLENERSELISIISSTIQTIEESMDKEGESKLFNVLSKQIETLKQQQNVFTVESQEYREKNSKLREEIHHLNSENFLLEQKLSREQKKRESLKLEIMENETEKERFKELHFNLTKMSPRNTRLSPRRSPSPQNSLGIQISKVSSNPNLDSKPLNSPRTKQWIEENEKDNE
eukprot:gene2438-3149_t